MNGSPINRQSYYVPVLRQNTAIFAVAFWAAGGVVHADEIRLGGTGAAHGILQILGEAYSTENPGDAVEIVSGLGSSGGIAAVSEGALTLAVSSRPLRQNEKAKGLDGIPFIDTPFMFVTSNVANLTISNADVVAIHDGTLRKWPNNKGIKPILRPRSDTASALLIESFSGMQAAMDKLRQRPEVPVAATDQDNLQAAEEITASFTAMTLLQFLTERPRLHAIMLDGVQPSVENMQAGKYTLRTNMQLITSAQPSAVARRFIAFTRTPQAQQLIRENGGVPISAQSAAVQ
jgi:phosphate transport system substrate-binding protein